MKNLRVFTIALCAMALAMGGTSCKKDNKQSAGERMVIGAGINQGGGNGSKTYVGDIQSGEYPVLWADGDSFDLFSETGTEAQPFGIEDGVGKTSGKFAGIDPGGSKYFGFYPAGAGTRSGNTFTCDVEGTGYADGTCQSAPMFGYSPDGKDVMFENVMSWVKIGLRTNGGTANVTSVSLGAKNDAAVMKGTLTVSFDGEGNITKTEMSGSKHSLTVQTNIEVNSTSVQYVSFLVPESIATSWIFTVYSDDSDWEVLSYEKTISGGIERNGVYVGEITISDETGINYPGDETYSGAIPGSSDSDDPGTGGGGEGTTAPEGALSGLFSVSADQKVYFSKGNLYADIKDDAGTLDGDDPWHFEDEQYYYRDYYGIHNNEEDGVYANLAGGTETPEGTVGMFYWSPNKATACSKEWNGEGSNDADVFFTNKDDVVLYDNNAWYTLSTAEWEWLLGPGTMASISGDPNPGENCRTSSTVGGVDNARFAWVSVNGVPGMLIFPDVFTWDETMGDVPTNKYINNIENITAYTISNSNFTALENAGCAFLPAAGWRNAKPSLGGKRGLYWSTSFWAGFTGYPSKFQFDFVADYVFSTDMIGSTSEAMPVRLVINAE